MPQFQLKESYQYLNPYDFLDTFTKTNWYLILEPFLERYFYNPPTESKRSKEWKETKKEWLKMMAELLSAGLIKLGDKGENFDEERKTIDTIVIHHTSTPTNTPTISIDAIDLVRLYAKEYSNPKRSYFATPLWSSHFYKSKQTFIPYHYLIREDGTFEKILKDEYIGWHCGNWDYNCKSIALCFVNDLTQKTPPQPHFKRQKQL